MKNKLHFAIMLCLFIWLSCKKEAPQTQQAQPRGQDLEKGILNFSVNGQLVKAVIDTSFNTITVTVLNSVDVQHITVNFALASQLAATINNKTINSGVVLDLSSPVMLTVNSAGNGRSISFKLVAQTELGYFGLGGIITSQKSLTRDYSFYFDQFDGSAFQGINCGPASTTMAIKWADSTFTKKPVEARNQILPQGGWWYTGNVSTYLTENRIPNIIDTLSNLDSLVKARIDNNNGIILCLDMFFVPFNGSPFQHVQKFYNTDAAGWGHFIFIKGYMQLGNNLYLDAYDPYSDGNAYATITPGQLKGKDRYYLAADITRATKVWWPYAIIIAPKGQIITPSTKLQRDNSGKPKLIPQAFGR